SGSTYLANVDPSGLSGAVLQVTGINDTVAGPTFGGGTVNAVNVATLASTPLLTTPGGTTAYKIPSGDVLALSELSNTIGGGVISNGASATSMGAAYDLSHDLFVPVTLTSSNLTLY
ncbi:MAG: hypothetical protein ACREU6_11850, partial [Steroidobacteraceae bacterium]